MRVTVRDNLLNRVRTDAEPRCVFVELNHTEVVASSAVVQAHGNSHPGNITQFLTLSITLIFSVFCGLNIHLLAALAELLHHVTGGCVDPTSAAGILFSHSRRKNKQ